MHASFSQDGCYWEGFWEVDGHVASLFDLSWTLPVGGGLLVPYSFPGPPVVKQLMWMVTREPGHSGQFQSVCFPWHCLEMSLSGFKSRHLEGLDLSGCSRWGLIPSPIPISRGRQHSLYHGMVYILISFYHLQSQQHSIFTCFSDSNSFSLSHLEGHCAYTSPKWKFRLIFVS